VERERALRWALVGTGLGAVTIITVLGIFLAANNDGVWLVALLPLGAVASGALLLAGHEP
jgi:hypothetical protein